MVELVGNTDFGRSVVAVQGKRTPAIHVEGVPLNKYLEAKQGGEDPYADAQYDLTPEAVTPKLTGNKVNMSASQKQAVRDAMGINDDAPAPYNLPGVPARSTFSTQDQIASAELKRNDPTTYWDIQMAAFRQDNSTYKMLRQAPKFDADVDFDPVAFFREQQPRFDAMPGIDVEEMSEIIGSAGSAEEAEWLLSDMEQDFADETLMSQNAAKGITARLLAGVTDPIDIGITLATLPISAGASAAYKMGKLGKAITTALTAGGATGATEAYLARHSAFRDEYDVAFATAAGFILGGMFGGLSKADNAELQKIVNDVAKGDIDKAARSLGVPDSAGAKRVAHGSDGEETLPLAPKKKQKEVDEVLDDMENPKYRFRGVNALLQNFQNTLFYSAAERTRKFASKMLEGGFLANKGVRGVTAEARAQYIRKVFDAGIWRESLPEFKAWAKANGKGGARRLFSTDVGEEFYSEVGRALRGEVDGLSKEALTAAGKMRSFIDNMHDLAEAAGVKGFDAKAIDDYFPRMLNKNAFDEKIQKVGSTGVIRWYREAIIAANEDISDEIAESIAKNYVRTMRAKVAGMETDLTHGIRIDDLEHLQEMFTTPGMTKTDVQELQSMIDALTEMKLKSKGQAGQVSHAKRRIQFDESFEAPMKFKDGEEVSVKFHEMYENDARRVLKRYGQVMSGHIGMAAELGIKSADEFENFKKSILSDAEKNGTDINVATKEVEALEDAYRLMLGQPIEANPGGELSRMSRTMTAYTYILRGGQFGINALAEAGNIIGMAGVRAFLRSVPEYRSMMKRAADGQLEHNLARQAELLFAPGISTLTGHAIKNLDELGEGFSRSSGLLGRMQAAVDPYLKSGGKFISVASGLSPITDITQRIAGVEYLRKLARFANGKKISKGQATRLRAAGLDDKMQERIFKMFREENAGIYRNGRLVDLDTEKWTDMEALDAMNLAAHREIRSVIQENDIASVTKYFHSPIGRMIFQFLRFPMEAVNKQLLRGIHHADGETAKSWAASMFIGTTVYMAQTSIEYANDPEERKKRLTTANVARVGFMRTGFSSMAPGAIDNTRYFMGQDPWFAMGRSSGLGTNIWEGNASIQTIKAAGKGVGGITRSLLSPDIQYSQGDARHLSKLIPGYRLLGAKNGIHAIEKMFPAERTQK